MKKFFALVFLTAAVSSSAAFAGDYSSNNASYEGATQGFAQVFGIPKGFHNDGIRTPQKTVCTGRLTLDLDHCGTDPDGRKYCLNKCVY